MKYGKLEIISGDANGTVIVWWLKTGDIVQRCKAHRGVVTDLQFDATKIVTSGVDHNLQVIDITTGEVLQTLRGHEGPVVGLAFDQIQIISVSSDGTLRHWEWGSVSKRADKLHIYDSGDNLAKISRKYKVPISDIIKFNGIKDVKKIYVGQKLIVQKGNPDCPTEAELTATTTREKDRQREAKVDDKIKLAMEKAEAEMAKSNGVTQANELLKSDGHVEEASVARRLIRNQGSLLPHEYLDVTLTRVTSVGVGAVGGAPKSSDYSSLQSRILHGGKTKDQMREKVSSDKKWEQNVNDSQYTPDRSVLMMKTCAFLIDSVVSEIISKDVVKECARTVMFNESLNGRFFNYAKGLGGGDEGNRIVKKVRDAKDMDEFVGGDEEV